MGKRGKKSEDSARAYFPALSPEARENQMIALAENLAMQQLMDGTASPSTINHYLKLATTRERLEKEILSKQRDLIIAKTEALQSAKEVEELYKNALSAMRSYAYLSEDSDDGD